MKIITLHPSRWRAYRKLRLKALRVDPDAFGQKLCDAEKISEGIWKKRLELALRARTEWIFFAESGKKIIDEIIMEHILS